LISSSSLRLLDFLSGVRINLQAIPRVVMSVEEEPDHENGCDDHQKQKPFHLTM
jgi:hypothetical protein